MTDPKLNSSESGNIEKSNHSDSSNPVAKHPKKDQDVTSKEKTENLKQIEQKESKIDYVDEINNIADYDINKFLDYFSDAIENIDENTDIPELSKFVDEVKILFFKKYHSLINEKKKQWVEEGGKPEDFKLTNNDEKERFDYIYSKFKTIKKAYNEKLEAEKEENLKKKLEIIERIKNLVHTEESLNATFKTFKLLEKQWKEIKQVPASKVKEIWGKYNFAVEQFYDFIKINKELRNLDQKKNYQEKINLCETAEALPYEKDPVKAFQELQLLHEQWRNIGPVAPEDREKIWERFSLISTIINKAHNEFHLKRKQQEEENLRLKTVLCEKAEAIAGKIYEKFSEWKTQQNNLKSLDAEWRTIGRVPRKYNVSIYQRFRDAFTTFFNNKNAFYEKQKAKENDNLTAKIKLCEAVEKWQDSNDFTKATHAILELQKQWKEIGPVPRNKSEEVWQRFRSACNIFFERKTKAIEAQKNKEEENLKIKESIIKEMEAFEPLPTDKENMEAIKQFQKRWDETGFVPKNKAETINKTYHHILTKLFDAANIDKVKQQILSYSQYLKNKQNSSNFKRFLETERSNIRKQIQEIEKEIHKIENSLSRFSVSKNSEVFLKTYINELEKKKERHKILTKKNLIIKNFFNQL